MRCAACGGELTGSSAVCPRCGFQAEGSFWSARADSDTPSWPRPSPAPPILEGRYRLEAFIARGGMGDVHRAVDLATGRIVSMKLLAERYLSEPEVVRRFLREARALASIDHPNVVRVHAFGEHGGRPFLVMDCLEGRTIAARLRGEGRYDLATAVGIVEQVCDGLAHIHEKGYVHRDVKPQNVIVEPSGRAVLLDFGVVRVAGGGSTRTVLLAGTPDYMSPEQALDPGRADARSDLYSLAVAFFEMVTGRLPFESASPLKVLLQHQAKSPPSARRLNPALPATADSFFRRALAKRPAARFRSAPAFRAELGGLLANRALPGAGTRSRRSISVAAAILFLGCAVAMAFLLRDEPGPAPGRAITPAIHTPAASMPAPSRPHVPAPRAVAPPSPAKRPPTLPSRSLILSSVGHPPTLAPRRRRRVIHRRRKEPASRERRPRALPPRRAPAPVAAILTRAARQVPEPQPPPPPPAALHPATLHVVTLNEGRGIWARIYVDGVLVTVSHAAYRGVAPGSHSVSARREGFRGVTRSVTLESGEHRKLVLALEEE